MCCSWLELGERLQLDFVKDKCLTFIQAQVSSSQAGFLDDKENLDRLQHSTLGQIVTMCAAPLQKERETELACVHCVQRYVIHVLVSKHRGWYCPSCAQFNNTGGLDVRT